MLKKAPVAQRIEHLTTDQKVRGSNPLGRAFFGFRLKAVIWCAFGMVTLVVTLATTVQSHAESSEVATSHAAHNAGQAMLVETQALPPEGSNFATISVGKSHVCIRSAKGGVFCAGDNYFSQLGRQPDDYEGTEGYYKSTPMKFGPVGLASYTKSIAFAGDDPVFKEVSSGGRHTCAVSDDGRTWCWGLSEDGRLGPTWYKTLTRSPLPLRLPAGLLGTDFSSVSAGGSHTCAVTEGGQVFCWGDNTRCQLGHLVYGFGTCGRYWSSDPVHIEFENAPVMAAVSTGDQHTCALSALGRVYCWGDNYYGQSGDNFYETIVSWPKEVYDYFGDTGFNDTLMVAVSVGDSHSCALSNSGQVFCWGDHPSWGPDWAPQAVEQHGLKMTAIAAGTSHTCALSSVGRVYCWGNNSSGQLGSESSDGWSDQPLPVDTSGALQGKHVVSIDAGGDLTCALDSADDVFCWGEEEYCARFNWADDSCLQKGRWRSSVPVAIPAQLRVPTSPTAVTARRIGSGQVSVSWSAPASGGSEVTGYSVTATPGGRTCSTSGARSCSVTGLVNGTAYTFTVIATNAAGSSLASSASPVVVPFTVPSAPAGVVGVAGNGRVVVSWSASDNGGSAITSYTVTTSPGGKQCSTTGVTTCTIAGLANGADYTFTVTATNAAGTSEASSASLTVVPFTVPSASAGVVGVAGNGRVVVSWSAGQRRLDSVGLHGYC